jgi:RND family efflux transporter MFP subunit
MIKLFWIVFFSTISFCASSYAQVEESPIIRVELKPQKQATMNSPMTGRITALSVKDGDSVKKGQPLITFQCGEFKAQVSQAKARVNRQNKLLTSTQKLYDLGSASKTDVNVLKADRDEATASQQLAQALVNKCTVKAPFNGHVAALSVKNHSSLQEGEQMIEIIGGNALNIEMIVPSKWMLWLKANDVFQVEIEETAQRYPSKVLRYGGKVDPVTQSVKLYAQVNEEASGLLPGMSGVAYFNIPDIKDKVEADDTIIKTDPSTITTQN